MYLAQEGARMGWQAAPTCSKDGQGEVGDGFPGVGLALRPVRLRPQDGQGPCMAVAPQQLPVLRAEDVQGGLQTGRVPGLDHLLHQLQGQEGARSDSCAPPTPSRGQAPGWARSQGRGHRGGVAHGWGACGGVALGGMANEA